MGRSPMGSVHTVSSRAAMVVVALRAEGGSEIFHNQTLEARQANKIIVVGGRIP